ncbi:MAG: hypothetical protein IJ111_01245 [Eggerthellaceae bacterium]|nr:hypothetical protein [Eggerthellaceae bacterium]
MALTRSMLKAMGIEEEKIDQIIESHTETVDALKQQRDDLNERASKVPALEKKVEELEAAKPTEDFEAKYNEEHEAFEQYKVQIAQQQAEKEKADLYRALLSEQGIDAKRLDSIMKVTDLSGVTVVDGELADRETLAEKAKTEWEAFIPQTSTKGAEVDTPPASSHTVDGVNPETAKRLQERHERLYGKSTNEE